MKAGARPRAIYPSPSAWRRSRATTARDGGPGRAGTMSSCSTRRRGRRGETPRGTVGFLREKASPPGLDCKMYASSLQSQHVSSSRGRFSALTSSTTCCITLLTLSDFLVAGLPLVDGDGGDESICAAAIRSSVATTSRRFPPVAGDSSDESSGYSLVGSLGIVVDTKRAMNATGLIVPRRTVLDDCERKP